MHEQGKGWERYYTSICTYGLVVVCNDSFRFIAAGHYLGSLVSGTSLSNGILSLRNWLKPYLVNPSFSSSLSASVSGSKPPLCSGEGILSAVRTSLLFDAWMLLLVTMASREEDKAKQSTSTHLLRVHLAIK